MFKKHFLLFLFIALSVQGQEKSVRLKGKVIHANKGVQLITVHNARSNKGEITPGNGVFNLSVQLGDSIHFSSLEYIKRVIIISDYHIKNKILNVYLEPLVNELNEVFLDKKIHLDFSNLYVAKNIQLDVDEIDLRKPPNAVKLTNPNQRTSFNFIAIISLFTKNIRKKNREKKALFNREEKAKTIFLENIIDLYGDKYLQQKLHIPEDRIYQFIEYCNDKGVTILYRNNPIDVLDFLVKRSLEFNKIISVSHE
ncbi:MAG: hypothetical protein COB98_02160 [Flavobacteriaceae bacterium]|nr:MAG: hypothetical protein COB98_02160 [Flavobacteriaceae bacterium]